MSRPAFDPAGTTEGTPGDRTRPWLLAIDTSTGQAGIALCDGVDVAEVSWPGGRRQTTTVPPAIESLLAVLEIGTGDIGAVAVAIGPGSFTSLRVGLSLAKGFAITGNVAVIGVPTLDLAAAPYRDAGVPAVVLLPAGRGRVVWSAYPASGEPGVPRNTSFDEFLDRLPDYPDAIVAGELTDDLRIQITAVHGKLASPAMSMRRPGVLAELGFGRWRRGEIDDPNSLEPLYLHGQPNPR